MEWIYIVIACAMCYGLGFGVAALLFTNTKRIFDDGEDSAEFWKDAFTKKCSDESAEAAKYQDYKIKVDNDVNDLIRLVERKHGAPLDIIFKLKAIRSKV